MRSYSNNEIIVFHWGYSGQNVVSTYHNKDEDNSLKNHNQNNTHQASPKKFRQINVITIKHLQIHQLLAFNNL